MATHIFREIRAAVRHLNPDQVRQAVDRPLVVGLAGRTSESVAQMEAFFAPSELSRDKRLEVLRILHRMGDPGSPDRFDLEVYEEGMAAPAGTFVFWPRSPGHTVREILEEKKELGLVLARHFPPFRKPVVDRTVQEIAQQNALFALLTAMPNAVPTLFSLGWTAGEFASDTAFLTVNQVRMAFLIAAASDHEIGYLEQKGHVASIIAAAFGWRALARQLVGKVPFGGGLIPKAAVAYAGTYVVGQSLERYYRIGYGFTRQERRAAYEEAVERGKAVARSLLDSVRRTEAA